MTDRKIPNQLQYGNKLWSAPARNIRSNIAPLNTTSFAPGDIIRLNIPTHRNQVLATTKSYLKFDLFNS